MILFDHRSLIHTHPLTLIIKNFEKDKSIGIFHSPPDEMRSKREIIARYVSSHRLSFLFHYLFHYLSIEFPPM